MNILPLRRRSGGIYIDMKCIRELRVGLFITHENTKAAAGEWNE